ARLVDVYARRPQVQERLTSQVADTLVEVLEPRGAIVVVECEHLCMSMRGVRKPGSRTITSAVRRQMRDPATRAEAISLILDHLRSGRVTRPRGHRRPSPARPDPARLRPARPTRTGTGPRTLWSHGRAHDPAYRRWR